MRRFGLFLLFAAALMIIMVFVITYATFGIDRDQLMRDVLQTPAVIALHDRMHQDDLDAPPAVAQIHAEGAVSRRKATNPCFPLGNATWACVPKFIIVGAMKAGTTFLYYYLSKHPHVAKTVRKEIFFFNFHFWKGIKWYASHFQYTPGSQQIMGEGTPFYFNNPYVPERIYQTIPNAKIIVILRDPVERAVSQYTHGLHWLEREHYVPLELTFDDLLHEEYAVITTCFHPELLPQFKADPFFNPNNWKFYNSCRTSCEFCFPYNNSGHITGHPSWGVLLKGHYVEHLKAYHKFFPNNQVLVLQYEDIDKPDEMFRQIEEFLEIPHHQFSKEEFLYVNRNEKPEISPSTRKWLREYYQPYNEELKAYLGRDFKWQKPGDPLEENVVAAAATNKSLNMAQAQGRAGFHKYTGPLRTDIIPCPAPPPKWVISQLSQLYDNEVTTKGNPQNPAPKKIVPIQGP